jgi:two-component system NtrC family sensor kinase
MRLKNSIFLWAVPAALIPLALLGFIATSWSEQVYLDEIDRELSANLDNAVTAIQGRFLIERDLVAGLARVPEVEQYLPVLQDLADGRIHPHSMLRFERVNHFLETFQSVRTSLDTIRILDLQGNSLVKVSDGKRSAPVYEGFGGLPYVEDEPEDPRFAQALRSLSEDQAGSLLLTGNLVTKGIGGIMPVYNTVFPLRRGDSVVGFLTINPPLLPLNRLLSSMPGVHGSSLLIAELDSEQPERDGLVLFDPQKTIDLVSVSPLADRLQTSHPALYENGFAEAQGIIASADEGMRLYYQTFLPYPDALVTWVVALQLRPSVLSAPFRNIRFGILLNVLIALLLSVLLARAAARQIAEPALNVAAGLTGFAKGQRGHRILPDGPEELRTAGRAFNDMADALEKAEQERDAAMAAQYHSRRLASLGHMAGGIAHEINNPINTILSLTTLIDRELPADADDIRSDVRSIREETERIANIVHAILNFSRDIVGEATRFDVEAWVRETIDLAATEQRNIDVPVEIVADERCQIEGDRRLLQRVLLNLLENATYASPPGKVVSIRFGCVGDAVAIEVIDQGMGLNDEQREQAFDPFFTTKPEGVGSGLGLSLSLGIVQFHGGSLELSNRAEGGAVAKFVLPQRTGRQFGREPSPTDATLQE